MIRLKLIAALLCAFGTTLVNAQVTPGGPANIGGTLYASNFANWSVPQGNNGPLAWSYSTACTSATSGGATFKPFVVGSPIRIVDSNPSLSETVTVTSVRPSGSGCMINVSPSNIHQSFYITTATAGLQEAINFSNGLQSVVVVTPDFTKLGGVDSTIIHALGNTNVTISDMRGAPSPGYAWNPSTNLFQLVPISAGVSAVNGLTGAVGLVAGNNITLTPSGQNISIASIASGCASGSCITTAPTTSQDIAQPAATYTTQNGIPFATVNSDSTGLIPTNYRVATSGNTQQIALGDSITFGTGSPSPSRIFVNQLNVYAGSPPLHNYAIPGETSCAINYNQTFQFVNPTHSSHDLLTKMSGVNDAGNSLTESQVKGCNETTIFWSGTAREDRIDFGAGTIPSGWSVDNTYPVVSGIKTTTNGSTFSFSFTTTAINQVGVLYYNKIAGDNGSVFCNETTTGTFFNLSSALDYTGQSLTQNVGSAYARFFAAAGTTITEHCTSTNPTTADVVSLLSFGLAPAYISATTPVVIDMATTRVLSLFNTDQIGATANVAKWIQQDANLAFNLGFADYWVNTRTYWTGAPLTFNDSSPTVPFGDGEHPNGLGEDLLYQSTIAPLGFAPDVPPDTIGINGATYQLGSTNTIDYSQFAGSNFVVLNDSTTYPYVPNCNDYNFLYNGTSGGEVGISSCGNNKTREFFNAGSGLLQVDSPYGPIPIYPTQGLTTAREGPTGTPLTINGVHCNSFTSCLPGVIPIYVQTSTTPYAAACNLNGFVSTSSGAQVLTLPTGCNFTLNGNLLVASAFAGPLTINGATGGTVNLTLGESVIFQDVNGGYNVVTTPASGSATGFTGTVTFGTGASPASCVFAHGVALHCP